MAALVQTDPLSCSREDYQVRVLNSQIKGDCMMHYPFTAPKRGSVTLSLGAYFRLCHLLHRKPADTSCIPTATIPFSKLHIGQPVEGMYVGASHRIRLAAFPATTRIPRPFLA